MTLDTFFEKFDLIADMPRAVGKMRELILTLAMRGELVEQDPGDPPASELLKEIEAEKKRGSHGGTGARRKTKKLPPISDEEIPYPIPEGWEWVRLGEIGIVNPRNNVEDELEAGFVPMPQIDEGYSIKHGFETLASIHIFLGIFLDTDLCMALMPTNEKLS